MNFFITNLNWQSMRSGLYIKQTSRLFAKQVQVPVIAINSDASLTDIEANHKYLKDYDYVTIEGVGHYPMLENLMNSILFLMELSKN